jgi:hypothetical protein
LTKKYIQKYHYVFQTITPVDQSTQGTPFEKGNAEEDGNCAIHGRSSNRPMTDSRN